MTYTEFIHRKSQCGSNAGFAPLWLPDFLIDFQAYLVEWAIRKGRCAVLADCGLGKTPILLVWSENVARQTNGNVLILTPLAVSHQTIREGEKFGVEVKRSTDGKVAGKITVTNYEKLHLFDPADYVAVVCDESGILKSYSGTRRKAITRFMSKMRYRLLCTATAAPNDYTELGNSSEALGEINYSEMLRRFFWQLDDKGQKREQRLQDEVDALSDVDPDYFAKLAFRVAQSIGQWRLKHHAVTQFWRWVASWAKACRRPSELGFPDDGFILPPLTERDHIIQPKTPPPGFLFTVPAFGMHEERKERRRTLQERCEFVANLIDHGKPAIVWCHMNPEGDLLEEIIPDAQQVAGKTSDERTEELFQAFSDGQLRVLVSKPKIGGWGMNWQHCAHVVSFVTHSYEQDYQTIRRCWRFGQKNPVVVDRVATEGEVRVIGNVRRKARQADAMFDRIIAEMNRADNVQADNIYTLKTEQPKWLSAISL